MKHAIQAIIVLSLGVIALCVTAGFVAATHESSAHAAVASADGSLHCEWTGGSESKASMPAPGILLVVGVSTGSVGWLRRRQIA